MAAPTFIQEAETAWNVETTPKVSPSLSVVANDILIVFQIAEGNSGTMGTPTNTGTGFTWNPVQNIDVLDYVEVRLWSAVATATQSMTVSCSMSSNPDALVWGANTLLFRGSDGVGASNKTNVSSGAPTLNLTTTQANSAIVVANGDWNATDGASRTWRTGAGTLTEQTYFRSSVDYTVYGGYHADAGAVGTYAVGLSAPTGQKYAIAAVEIKGTVAAGSLIIPPRLIQHLIMAGH